MGINIKYESGEKPLSEKKSEVFVYKGQLYRITYRAYRNEPGEIEKVCHDDEAAKLTGQVWVVCMRSGDGYYFKPDTLVKFVEIDVYVREV